MMMVGLMLTMMLGAQAQTKVAPKMAKGRSTGDWYLSHY